MCHNKNWDFGQNSSPVCVKPGCNTAWFQFHLKNYEVKFGENKAIAKIFCHPGHQINGTTKVTHFLKVNTMPPFTLCFTVTYIQLLHDHICIANSYFFYVTIYFAN